MATYYLPDNLNLAKLLDEQPPTDIKDFKIDHLIYIVHLVITLPSNNKGCLTADDFVPINARILQTKVRHYTKYLNYLIKNHILITDNLYIKGVKSIGYKLAVPYNRNIVVFNQESKQAERLLKLPCMPIELQRRYKHVIKWFNKNFRINQQAAMDFIEADLQHKLSDPANRDYDYMNKTFKDPWQQYRSAKIQIQRLATGDYPLSIDDTVGRLHSPLTNMNSALRNFLSYNSEALVCFDIANCQPFLATALFNLDFWTPRSDSNTLLSIRDLPSSASYYSSSLIDDVSTYIRNNISNSYFSSSSSFIRICKTVESGDMERYREITSKGELYSYFRKEMIKNESENFPDKHIKSIVFQTFFTDNRFFGQPDAAPKRLFKAHFPTIYDLFSIIKRKDKTALPRLLQRIESYLILDVVTREIAQVGNKIPLFTIHDSIATTPDHSNIVKDIISRVITLQIGIKPTLSWKLWTPDNTQICKRSQVKIRAE